MTKHDGKWLEYEDDGRDEPGVRLRITKRFIELIGGLEKANDLLSTTERKPNEEE